MDHYRRAPRAWPGEPRSPHAGRRPRGVCETSSSSPFEYPLDTFAERRPTPFYLLQTLAACLCEPVDARPPAVSRGRPFGVDEAGLLAAVQRGVERAFLHTQHLRRGLFDA